MVRLSRCLKISEQRNRRQSQRRGGRPKPKPLPLTLITGVDGSFCSKKSEDDCKKIKACDWMVPNATQTKGYCKRNIDSGTGDSTAQFKQIEAENARLRARALDAVYNTNDDDEPMQSIKPMTHDSHWFENRHGDTINPELRAVIDDATEYPPPSRKPRSHESKWTENTKITPEIRALRANTRKMLIENYDIVINTNESGFRNYGKFIYYNNGLHHLSSYPDGYGSLPKWVVPFKGDCGFSYFKNYLIDHNSWVPFKTSDWEIGPSKVTEAKPFKYAYTYVDVTTKLMRKDGAECDLVVSVMISAPWLGGPTDDVKHGNDRRDDVNNYEVFEYRNGDTCEIEYMYERETFEKILLAPPQSELIITPSALEKAEKLVNDALVRNFRSNKYVYLLARERACHFVDDYDEFLRDEHKFKKIIVLEEP